MTKQELLYFCSKCKKEITVKIQAMEHKERGIVINIVSCSKCDRFLNDEILVRMADKISSKIKDRRI